MKSLPTPKGERIKWGESHGQYNFMFRLQRLKIGMGTDLFRNVAPYQPIHPFIFP